MITSSGNAQMKHVAQLLKKHTLRQKEQLFVIEGWKLFEELPKDRLVKLYVSEEAVKNVKISQLIKDYPYELVKNSVFQEISDTLTPQGILAIARQQDNELKTLLTPQANLLLLLDHIQDPGNLGTIIRMSEAAGVDGVIMSADTVDIYNPKVVRSTMGAIFRVPFCYTEDLAGCIREMKKQGIDIYGAALDKSVDYALLDYRNKCAFAIGNEANGLSEKVKNAVTRAVHIPMAGEVESLNAAVAAAVLVFEAYRQKRL